MVDTYKKKKLGLLDFCYLFRQNTVLKDSIILFTVGKRADKS